MKIAISGGTGYIGGHLKKYFIAKQHEVIVVSRSNQAKGQAGLQLTWEQLAQDCSALEGLDAFINLSGESVNKLWTNKTKEAILNSRLSTATQVASIVARLHNKPKVVINGSGMSIYGTSEIKVFDENSPSHVEDFLSSVVEKWEQAIDQIQGTRVVKLRVGLVISSDGGILPKMMLPYRFGVGGKVGSGKQWISWIHLEDMIRMIEFCMLNDQIQGPVNATAPHPVTNDEFGRAIGRALHRPHLLPLPGFLLNLIVGELASLLLKGQRVIPKVLLDHGFQFHFSQIDEAMKNIVNNK